MRARGGGRESPDDRPDGREMPRSGPACSGPGTAKRETYADVTSESERKNAGRGTLETPRGLLLRHRFEKFRKRNSEIGANRMERTDGDIGLGGLDTSDVNLRIHIHNLLGNAALFSQLFDPQSNLQQQFLITYLFHFAKRQKNARLLNDIFVIFVFLSYICRADRNRSHRLIIQTSKNSLSWLQTKQTSSSRAAPKAWASGWF